LDRSDPERRHPVGIAMHSIEPDKVVGYFKCSGTQRGRVARPCAQRRRVEVVEEIHIFRVGSSPLRRM
jgi:hypothetical protein